MILRNTLRDEGLFSTACPAFISTRDGLKKLSVYEYRHQVVGARNKKHGSKQKKNENAHMQNSDGGIPPTSSYPKGTTIWKWAKLDDKKPKEWIEFERLSGRPMSEVELDEYEDDDDSDGAMPPFGMPANFLAQAIPAFLQNVGVLPTGLHPDSDVGESDDEMPELVNFNSTNGNPGSPVFDGSDGEMPELADITPINGNAASPLADDTDDEMPGLMKVNNTTSPSDLD